MSEVSAQEEMAEPNVEEVTAAIEAAFTEYGASLGDGDAERWIELWMEDGMQLPPGAPPNVGRDMILANIQRALSVLAFEDMQIQVDEVLVKGDTAIARGMYTVNYVPHDGSPITQIDGKYTTTFMKQEDGSWKIYRDIFNSNVPPAAPAETDVEAITAEIQALFDEYSASLNDGDAERWIALWTEDAVQSSPGAPPNVGRDVIYAGVSSEVKEVDYQDMIIEVEEVLAGGEYAIARGNYSLVVVPMAGGDPMSVDGKYTTTFQRQPDGSWKIHRDIYNSNVPPAAPAEPDVEAITAEEIVNRWLYLWDTVNGDLEGAEEILSDDFVSNNMPEGDRDAMIADIAAFRDGNPGAYFPLDDLVVADNKAYVTNRMWMDGEPVSPPLILVLSLEDGKISERTLFAPMQP